MCPKYVMILYYVIARGYKLRFNLSCTYVYSIYTCNTANFKHFHEEEVFF